MLSIIEKITGKERQSMETARQRYAALLLSGDENTATETELAELMGKLGKSAADLRADYELVASLKTLQSHIDAGSKLEVPRSSARAKAAEYLEQTRELIKQRQAEQHRLVVAATTLENRHSLAERSTHELNELRQSRPDLFASVPTPMLT